MMSTESKNYYEVLEIPLTSSPEEVREGYLRAKNAFSGDSLALYSLMDPRECDDILEMIEEAYNILSDPEKRREYDRVRGFNQHHYQNIAQGAQLRSSPFIGGGRVPDKTSSHQNRPQNPVGSTGTTQKEESSPTQRYAREETKKDFQIHRNESEVSKIAAKNRYGLDYSRNQDMENRIENATEYDGNFLKEIREYKNVSIERLADMTKISKTYISFIEFEKVDKLPAIAYVRGFVFQIAKCLKLNPDLVANSYIQKIKTLKGKD